MKVFNSINKTFSKSETNIFKGIAILLIILHNFLHNQGGMQIENEFKFDSENIYKFLDVTFGNTVLNFVSGIFSFLGHYGVQIFFFFSAYGLTMVYEKWSNSNLKFVITRLRKIYFLMAYGVLIWVIIFGILGVSFGFSGTIIRFLILASTLNNFTTSSLFSGPFWFFAPIIQFYIIFPFLYKIITKIKFEYALVPILLSLILIYFLYFTIDGVPLPKYNTYSFSLYRNILGHLPELLLGIIMAHFKVKSFNWLTVIISLIVFVGSQIFSWMFPLSFLSVTILLIFFVSFLIGKLGSFWSVAFTYLGNISMILFIINSPFRSLFYNFFSPRDLTWGTFVVFFVLLFILSHPLYLLYTFISKKFRI